MARGGVNDLVRYGAIAGGGYLMFSLALHGKFGASAQQAAIDVLSSIKGPTNATNDLRTGGVVLLRGVRGPGGATASRTGGDTRTGAQVGGGRGGNGIGSRDQTIDDGIMTPREHWRAWQAARAAAGENGCDYDAFFYHFFAIAGYALGDEHINQFYSDGGCMA